VEIAVKGMVSHARNPNLNRNDALSREAASRLSSAINDFLSRERGLRVAALPQPSDPAWPRDRFNPGEWYASQTPPPCSEPFDSGLSEASLQPANTLIFLVARDWESSTEAKVGTAVMMGLLWPWVLAHVVMSPLENMQTERYLRQQVRASMHRELRTRFLLIGMADAQSRSILWVRTLRLGSSTNLYDPADAARVVRKAFTEPPAVCPDTRRRNEPTEAMALCESLATQTASPGTGEARH
jgi:hypothetical protein